MRTQLHGIYISLMVHGMAAIFLYGVSQGIATTTKTVVLDFSLDSGGRMGEEGLAAGGGSRGDEAQPQEEAPSSNDIPGDRKIAPPNSPGNTALSGVSDPQPLVAEEQPPVLEAMTPATETIPPVDEEPVAAVEVPPVLTVPPPEPEETPPVAQKPSPAQRIFKERKLIAVNKTISPKIVRPKPVPRKNTLEPVPEKKTETDPPVQTAQKTPPPTLVDSQREKKPASPSPEPKPAASFDSLSTVPDAGAVATADGSAESTNSGKGLPEAYPEHNGSSSQGGLADRGAGNGESLRGDGGSAYLKSHFNFIRGHLKEHLCYPSIARKRGWSGEVMVAFTIYPDGRADNIAIQKSCGISLLDKSAIKTVHNACPFPFPPMAARIVIPIVYQLN